MPPNEGLAERQSLNELRENEHAPATPSPPPPPPPQNPVMTFFLRLYEMVRLRMCYAAIIIGVLAIIVGCILFVFLLERSSNVIHSTEMWKEELSGNQTFWYADALNDLKEALKMRINTRRAKNVILFVGDGMGVNTVTASRIYKGGEGDHLMWEKFPHTALLKVSIFAWPSRTFSFALTSSHIIIDRHIATTNKLLIHRPQQQLSFVA